MRAWHFLREDRRLGYDDGRLVEPGVTLCHEGPVALCKAGLHASRDALDALRNAPWEPGLVISRVECGGTVVEGYGGLVCTARTAIWLAPADEVLRHFSRLCALDVVHLWEPPPVVLRWLRTGDESLRDAARDAAWNAADATFYTSPSAWYAARAAAWTAISGDARDAGDYAAELAARTCAGYAAAKKRQSRRLHRMLMKLGRETARDCPRRKR